MINPLIFLLFTPAIRTSCLQAIDYGFVGENSTTTTTATLTVTNTTGNDTAGNNTGGGGTTIQLKEKKQWDAT